MKISIILLLAILFFSVSLYSVSNFGGIFTLINYSASDNALGEIGTANIYNPSPLSVWSNPAKLGYYKGLSFGYTSINLFPDVEGLDDIFLNASYTTFGWHGIGIMVPSFNRSQKFGTTGDWGNQDYYDASDDSWGTFHSFETASNFAIGVNYLEFLSFMNGNPKKNKFHELSVGLSVKYISSHLSPPGNGQTEYYLQGSVKSFTTDLGLIYRFSPLNTLNSNYLHLDLNSGITFINPIQTKIKYQSSYKGDPLPYGTNFGISAKTMIASNYLNLLGIDNPVIKMFIKNFFSFTFVYDINQLGSFNVLGADDKVYGYGFEFSYLDIFSLREGRYVDEMGEVEGYTSGLGFNINFKDMLQIQYNTSRTPGGDLQDEKKSRDFMVKVDFLKLFQQLRQSRFPYSS